MIWSCNKKQQKSFPRYRCPCVWVTKNKTKKPWCTEMFSTNILLGSDASIDKST